MAFVVSVKGVGVERSQFRGKCLTNGESSLVCGRAAPSVGRQQVVMMGKGKNSKFRSMPMQQQGGMGPDIPEDGTPVFTVVVRSKNGARIWYPCGGVKGDNRAKTMVQGMKTKWGETLYQSALDRGIAQTIFRNRERWTENAVRQIPSLKIHRNDLEFGYRVSAAGMETSATRVLSPELALPFLQWAQKKIKAFIEPEQKDVQ